MSRVSIKLKHHSLIKILLLLIFIFLVVDIGLAFNQKKEEKHYYLENMQLRRNIYISKTSRIKSNILASSGINDMDQKESQIQNTPAALKNISDFSIPGKKVVYLTFDDGPSKNITPLILNTLQRYKINASFFLIGKMAQANSDLVKLENSQGNAVYDHTYSHDYNYVYSNPSNLVNEFSKCADIIKSILGNSYNVKYVRFPGGSFGTSREAFRNSALKAGYSYIDWNCLNGDAEGNNLSADRLFNRFKETAGRKNTLIVLMHDASTKATTAQALPRIIEYLKANGYIFKTLS